VGSEGLRQLTAVFGCGRAFPVPSDLSYALPDRRLLWSHCPVGDSRRDRWTVTSDWIASRKDSRYLFFSWL
jgi:hypothetical protein